MPSNLILKIAGPMIALSFLLLAIGVVAAYNVQAQQTQNAELIKREVNGMLATEDMFLVMREIRRELDLYLRNHQRQHLKNIRNFLTEAESSIRDAKESARTEMESELVIAIDDGLQEFHRQFHEISALPPGDDVDQRFAMLNDEILTNRILQPIRGCIQHNRQVVERTTQASLTTAQHMRLGFLLLGISGSLAGVLFGGAIARTLQRSIVQLDVSVRGVAGKLNEVSGGPVQISHYGDLAGIESSVRRLESEISEVVERLQLREVEVIRNEQLAVVGQLAAGMAHELRNPLMPVKVLVQAALDRGPQGSLSGHQLEILNTEVKRLEEAIQMLLDFARPPEPEMRKVDVADVVYRCLDLISVKAIGQHVELHTVVPEEKIIAWADATQLRQVLLNLLLNALDVLPRGGLVEVQLLPPRVEKEYPPPNDVESTSLHDAVRLAHHSAEPAKRCFTLRVLDTGPGFPPGVLEKVFQPFVTTKETGTGLGLSICQRIIKSHGGEIRVTNRQSGGAEFTIKLPCCA